MVVDIIQLRRVNVVVSRQLLPAIAQERVLQAVDMQSRYGNSFLEFDFTGTY